MSFHILMLPFSPLFCFLKTCRTDRALCARSRLLLDHITILLRTTVCPQFIYCITFYVKFLHTRAADSHAINFWKSGLKLLIFSFHYSIIIIACSAYVRDCTISAPFLLKRMMQAAISGKSVYAAILAYARGVRRCRGSAEGSEARARPW